MTKFYAYLLFGLLIFNTLALITPYTYAANLSVNVDPDKSIYNQGENVVITVMVRKLVGDMLLSVDGATVLITIQPPGGGIAAYPASPTGNPGQYRYIYHLTSSALGGVYQVVAKATKGADSGADQTHFSILGPSGKKTVDWAIYNPSITPTNPTANDFVTINAWIKIVATVSTGPYPLYIVCTVDGVFIDSGTIIISGNNAISVSADPTKYPLGTHMATWIIDPNSDYNDLNTGNNQVTFQFTVGTPAPTLDFSLTTSPSSKTINAGDSTTFNVAVNLVSGSTSSVSLSVTGLPAEATTTFNPYQGNPPYSSTLSINTNPNIPVGVYILTITGSGGGLTRTTTTTLTIQSAIEPDFELSIVPGSQIITTSQSANYLVSLTKQGDFKSTLSLTISGVPAGVQASFNPPSGIPDYTSTLTLTTTQTAQTGTHPLTIYVSGGGKTKSTTITLVIQAASATPTTTTSTPTSPTPTIPSIESIIDFVTEQPYLIIIIILLLVILALVIWGRKRG